MKRDYDRERCEALLPIISESAAKARSLGESAVDRIGAGIIGEGEAKRFARLAASHAIRWRSAWVEHSARITGSDVRDAGVCWFRPEARA